MHGSFSFCISGRPPPENTGISPNAVSMLGQRRRRWANIETAWGEITAGGAITGGGLHYFLLVYETRVK